MTFTSPGDTTTGIVIFLQELFKFNEDFAESNRQEYQLRYIRYIYQCLNDIRPVLYHFSIPVLLERVIQRRISTRKSQVMKTIFINIFIGVLIEM